MSDPQNYEIPDSLRNSLENTKVDYVRLGKSGLKISVPVLGAMSFGDPRWMPWVLDEDKVETLHFSRSSSARGTRCRNL
jgi:hypothetical protein